MCVGGGGGGGAALLFLTQVNMMNGTILIQNGY